MWNSVSSSLKWLVELLECLSRNLAMKQWVRHSVLNGFSPKQDEHQLRMMSTDRPSLSKIIAYIEKARKTFHRDCHQSFQNIASTVEISYGSYQSILTENLSMRLWKLSSACWFKTRKTIVFWPETTWWSFPTISISLWLLSLPQNDNGIQEAIL